MVMTIEEPIPFLFDCMTKIFDVNFSHVYTTFTGGRHYQFNKI